MSILIAIAWMALFACLGQLAAQALFADSTRLERIWLGSVAGLAAMIWLPALWSFALGFTVTSQLAAAVTATALCAGLAFVLRRRPQPCTEAGQWKPALVCCGPLWVFCCWLLSTHTIPMAADGGLHAGQSTYGDMCLHLGIITSISEQTTFPPGYSLLPGAQVGYPFLCDSVSSSFYTLGVPLRWAYMLPMFWALGCVLLGAWLLFARWLQKPGRASLAFWLFFGGGGFGFVYFLDGVRENPQNFTRIFTEFYQTPTNYLDGNIRWVNPVADLLIPQRATLFGWALLFCCLYLLYRAAIEADTRCFAPLGVLAGCLPLVHTHSFLALGIVSAVLLVRALLQKPGWRALVPWAVYAVLAVGLAAPQLFGFAFKQASEGHFLQLHFNWINETDNYFWFYIKNIGLVYLLLIPAFVHARPASRWFYGGGLAILAICEVMLFQPNPYDNNKLLYVWHLLGCGLVAALLADVWAALPKKRWRGAVAVCVVALGTVSGALTLAREAVSDYQLFSADETAAAEWAREQTPADALFLTADNHNNAVSSLAGRNIYCGSATFLYFHGLDYSDRQQTQRSLYESPSLEALQAEEIAYVLVGPSERGRYAVDEAWFAQNLEPVFTQGQATIYQVPA